MGLRGRALAALLLFGLVSLLADVSYEGFRGALGPIAAGEQIDWLALGAVLAGGELVNWVFRMPAALIVDRLGAYWGFTILGYALTPIGVLAAVYGGAVGLAVGVVLERLGKTIRGPARDALLSGLGGPRGLVYGLHELMDQVGAVAGPLVALYAVETGGYALLALPGALATVLVAAAKLVYPSTPARREPRGVSVYWMLAAIGFAGAAATPHPVIIASAAAASAGDAKLAPLAYMLAMLTDAVAALPLGRLYDKVGGVSLAAAPAAGVASYILLALGAPLPAAAAAGFSLAALETVYRAYAAEASPVRAAGFGALSLGRGLGHAAGAILASLIASRLYPPLSTL